MRAVLQRVIQASVAVDGAVVGAIERGWLVLLGVSEHDTEKDLAFITDKTINLRVFPDDADKFNLSLLDVKGAVLVVSQFTLYADCRKGRRPSFAEAAEPGKAKSYYEHYIAALKAAGVAVASGVFQAKMAVQLTNDGPVTIVLDSHKE